MTLLISWIGVDSKKEGDSVASLYIASDSRYTWGKNKYDYGIKVFGSAIFPDIFGFCGDVIFPSIVLGQLIPQIDCGLLFAPNDNCDVKHSKVLNFIGTSLDSYPKEHLNGMFTILHGTRSGKTFKCFKINIDSEYNLLSEEIYLPLISKKVFSGGSGKKEFDYNYMSWENEKHNDYRTSRGVYHCLEDTLIKIKDPNTGGKPQIVGLYRIGTCRLFGIVCDRKRYIYGKECFDGENLDKIEWRNENFERINPENLELVESAQRQPTYKEATP